MENETSAGLVQNNESVNLWRADLMWVAVIAAASFVCLLPVLFLGFPLAADDIGYHANWYECFANQLRAGELYPRWLKEMSNGLGSPAFFYYPPFSYYATFLINSVAGVFLPAASIWHQLGLGAFGAVFLSGAACYWWLKDTVKSSAAAGLASIIYLIMPYHLMIDLYTRGAYAELWAFVWMPLILKFTVSANGKTALNFVGLAISTALLLMTHLPTALIFSLVPLGYAFFCSNAEKRLRQFFISAAGMMLGAGLAAIYLLPAMLMQNLVSFNEQREGFFTYSSWFLFSFNNLAGEGRLALILSGLLASMIAALLLCVLFDRNLLSRRPENREPRFWLGTAVISILLMTPLSQPVWYLLPILQAVQFPYRFNTILSVATAAVIAIAFARLVSNFSEPIFGWRKTVFSGGLLLLCLFWSATVVGMVFKRYGSEQTTAQNLDGLLMKLRRTKEDVSEYKPQTAARAEKKISPAFFEQNTASPRILSEPPGEIKTQVLIWESRRIVFQVDAPLASNLIVGQYYFPHWRAFGVDGAEPNVKKELRVQPSAEGLVEVQTSAGIKQIEVILEQHWTERVGGMISLSAAFGLAIGALFLHRFQPIRF